MDKKVEECTRALIEAVRNSEEYQTFEKSKIKVEEYPELKRKTQVFRRRVFLMQNSDDSIDLLDEMNRLFAARNELYQNAIIAEYLTAELRLCRMLQKISMEVVGVTDIELESFEDVIPI